MLALLQRTKMHSICSRARKSCSGGRGRCLGTEFAKLSRGSFSRKYNNREYKRRKQFYVKLSAAAATEAEQEKEKFSSKLHSVKKQELIFVDNIVERKLNLVR